MLRFSGSNNNGRLILQYVILTNRNSASALKNAAISHTTHTHHNRGRKQTWRHSVICCNCYYSEIKWKYMAGKCGTGKRRPWNMNMNDHHIRFVFETGKICGSTSNEQQSAKASTLNSQQLTNQISVPSHKSLVK